MPSEQSDSFQNFIKSLNNEETKRTYREGLNKFTSFLVAKSYDDLLSGGEKEITIKVIKYVEFLNEKQYSKATQHKLLYGLRHFYTMNDVDLPWRKINKFRKPGTLKIKDRAYTAEEITLLLKRCKDLRTRIIIMLMACAGLRVGSIPELKVQDFEYLENEKLFAITVYAGTDYEYVTFCTPQCADYLKEYIQLGKLTDKFGSWFFSNKRERGQKIGRSVIQFDLWNAEKNAGIRSIDHGSRKETMLSHGFRKFFNTMLVMSDVKHLSKEMMMGHKKNLGIDVHYFKPSREELLAEYKKAIPKLSFSLS